MSEINRRTGLRWVPAMVAVAAAVCLAGCGWKKEPTTGKFEKTLNVSGPARLELKNGSGDVTIQAGAAGQVRIRGEVHAREFFFGGDRVEDYVNRPPIEQVGNIIRVGHERRSMRNVSINYTIEVPADTEVRASVGSGSTEIGGIRGAVSLTAGSGDIKVYQLGQNAEINTGSGDVEIRDVRGNLRAGTGSGDITVETVGGEVRASTGSGDIHVGQPGGRVTVKTGSGDMDIKGASADVRMSTGSGECRLEGNPSANSFWEVSTGSGDITLNVPDTASFRLHARSNNRIETSIPLTVEEQSKKELRARAGKGEARIEVDTSSGRVVIR